VDHPDHGRIVPGWGWSWTRPIPYRVMGDDHLATLEQLRNEEVGGVGRG
jgi:hypothetical protein